MIYAKSIAWSSAEGFRSKTCTWTFDNLVINSKKNFVPNVAAKVAITPKNSEKSYFCFFMMIFGDLYQNKKNNQICSFCPNFSLFLKFIFSPILSVTSKNLIVAKVQPYNSRNYSRIKIWCFAEIFDILKICQE